MGEWAVLSNVTMQIGTVIGTGAMATSFTIGSLSLTTVSGLDWTPGIILYDDYYAYDDQDYYGYDPSTDPYSEPIVGTVQSNLARQGYYRGVIDGVYGPQTRVGHHALSKQSRVASDR
jgi:hypothetical protein